MPGNGADRGECRAVEIELPALATAPGLPDVDTVGRFMLACLTKTPGEETVARAIYARYRHWCGDQSPAVTALAVLEFAEQFAARCKRHGIITRKDGDTIVCVGLKLIPPATRQALGYMHKLAEAPGLAAMLPSRSPAVSGTQVPDLNHGDTHDQR